jgi:hypothetical protein
LEQETLLLKGGFIQLEMAETLEVFSDNTASQSGISAWDVHIDGSYAPHGKPNFICYFWTSVFWISLLQLLQVFEEISGIMLLWLENGVVWNFYILMVLLLVL